MKKKYPHTIKKLVLVATIAICKRGEKSSRVDVCVCKLRSIE